MSIVTKESNPELYNSLFEDATIEDAKKVMQNMFNDITPEQFEELKKQALENVKKNNMSAREMFEKLGYEYSTLLSDQQRIYYEHKHSDNQPSNFIMFDLDYQIISNDCDITLEELQAINKQVEELGWKYER